MTQYDPLEVELAALRPREPSAKLRQQIAEQLAATACRRKQHPSYWQGGTFVAGLLAASLMAIFAWHASFQRTEPELSPVGDIGMRAAFDESAPSVWSYRCALLRSPDSLNGLLDRHAARAFARKAGGAPVFGLVRLKLETDFLQGEL